MNQFTHILGFARFVLGNKVNPTNVNRIKNGYGKRNDYRYNLIGFSRKYFNCNVIDDLEIKEFLKEDQCGEFIHLDAKVLLDEYITAFSYVQE